MENIDSVRGLQKLVQDPTEVFMNLMQKLVKDMVFEFMATTGVDTTIIKKCVNKSILVKMNSWIALTYLDCTIRSLNSVMDTKHTLESLKTQKLFDDVESLISEHVCTQNFIRIYSKQYRSPTIFGMSNNNTMLQYGLNSLGALNTVSRSLFGLVNICLTLKAHN